MSAIWQSHARVFCWDTALSHAWINGIQHELGALMLELGIGADLVRGVGWIVWILLFSALWWALRRDTKRLKVFWTVIVMLVFFGPLLPRAYHNWKYEQRFARAKAVFDERCKTSGAKIYKTVQDVDGVLLLNVPPRWNQTDRNNQNWPGAGLSRQSSGNSYIGYYLYGINSQNILTRDLPGYRFVDVKDDAGLLWRYTRKKDGDLGEEISGFQHVIGNRQSGTSARYAVSYTNLINAEDRMHWVAGTTATVTDTQTGEVLAQSTWYSFEMGFGAHSANRSAPWDLAVNCPDLMGDAPIRYFVEQVLKPEKGVNRAK